MKEPFRILISLDLDAQTLQLVKTLSKPSYLVRRIEKNGAKVLKQIQRWQPDLVIMDPCMVQLDAVGVMKNLRREGIEKPRIIVLSYYENPAMQKELVESGADYFIVRPFDVETTEMIIQDFLTVGLTIPPQRSHFLTPQREIAYFLKALRIPAQLAGYRYLAEAIELVQKHPDYIHSITKTVYPILAKRMKKTPGNIERSIRYAIAIGWKEARPGVWFGLDHRPTNAEFICLAAEAAPMMRLSFWG